MAKLTTNYFDNAGEIGDDRTADVCNISGILSTVIMTAGTLLEEWCDDVNENYARDYSMLGWVNKGNRVYERIATVIDEGMYGGHELGHKQVLTLADDETLNTVN